LSRTIYMTSIPKLQKKYMAILILQRHFNKKPMCPSRILCALFLIDTPLGRERIKSFTQRTQSLQNSPAGCSEGS